MAWLDRSETECQPCERFRGVDVGSETGPCGHACLADGCLGRVFLCDGCSCDHHVGGWNARGGSLKCLCNHAACVAAGKGSTPLTEETRQLLGMRPTNTKGGG